MLLIELDKAVSEAYDKIAYSERAQVIVKLNDIEYQIACAVVVVSKGDYGTLELLCAPKESSSQDNDAIEQLRQAGMKILQAIVNRHGYSVACSYVRHLCDHTEIEERCKKYGETKLYALAEQCRYALSNLDTWTIRQHPDARMLKQVLRDFVTKYGSK